MSEYVDVVFQIRDVNFPSFLIIVLVKNRKGRFLLVDSITLSTQNTRPQVESIPTYSNSPAEDLKYSLILG